MSRIRPNIIKNNFLNSFKSFNILGLRLFFLQYPLILYLRYDGGSTNLLAALRNYSLIHNFKIFMLNSKQLHGFMPSVQSFKFLTTGRCILLGFSSWEQLNFLITLNFLDDIKKFKVITISWNGSFFNLLQYKKLEVFDWLVDFCGKLSTNEIIIYNYLIEIIYILINLLQNIVILLINNILMIKK